MEIKYRNTIIDYLYLFILGIFKFPSSLILFGVPIYISFDIVDINFEKFTLGSVIPYIVTLFLCFICIFLIFIIVVSLFHLIVLFFESLRKKKSIYFDYRVLEISDDNIISKTDISKTEYLWSKLYKYKETKKYVLIFTNPRQALIVPKKSINKSIIEKILIILDKKFN